MVATNRIGRALAAYSHVIGLGQSREGDLLFRAMQGLEAFFCDGAGDLRKQLAEKLELWIGPIQDKRYSIGKLYEVRSRFVHGASHVAYYNSGLDNTEQDAKSIKEADYASTYAIRLLIATLQKCIERETLDLGWKFTYENEARG